MSVTVTCATSSSLAYLNNTPVAGAATPSAAMTPSNFMTLLATQLQNQDPTQPMDANQQMEQIVQISSMQNMQTMAANLTQMTSSQSWALANSYLGRQVTISNPSGAAVTGPVTAVNTSGSAPQVQVNGNYYDLSLVTNIQLAPTSTSSSPTSG